MRKHKTEKSVVTHKGLGIIRIFIVRGKLPLQINGKIKHAEKWTPEKKKNQ